MKARIAGTIFYVSSPKIFKIDKKPSKYTSNVSDYYHIVLTNSQTSKQIKVYMPISILGVLNIDKSVVEVLNKKTGKYIKTCMIRPERYKGCKVQVEGEAKESEAEIYVNRVTSFKILSEPKQINIRD